MSPTVQNQNFFESISATVTEPNAVRSVILLAGVMIIAYWLSNIFAKGIIWLAHIAGSRGDKETDDQRSLRYRQIETYLSIGVAVIRATIVIIAGYLTWITINPPSIDNNATNGIAAIGAGTIFILFAGQTVGIILRDLTAGVIMITEGWFHVGDYIKIEPYADVAGVVERFTLRSTRIRALNGEIIWVHNQNISGVHTTPRGVRTMAVEIFVKDENLGRKEVQKLIDALPTGKTMLASPLAIKSVEKWAGKSWRITVEGQTPPGREWLVDDYFFNEIKAIDDGKELSNQLLSRPPMVHMSDADANKRFRRAVRVNQE